jgi:predicted lipoprotein with Yx(FWY)xxD motif
MEALMSKLRALPVAALVLVLAACGSSSKSSTSSTVSASSSATSAPATSSSVTATSSAAATGGVKVSSATVTDLGAVLVNGQGRTLYVFAPDKAKKVTCTSSCASVWPPVVLTSGQKPTAAGSVRQSLLGSDPNPSGGQVVTYAGWPLYTYVADTAAGTASGQGLNLNGGFWYVIAPSGTLVSKKP